MVRELKSPFISSRKRLILDTGNVMKKMGLFMVVMLLFLNVSGLMGLKIEPAYGLELSGMGTYSDNDFHSKIQAIPFLSLTTNISHLVLALNAEPILTLDNKFDFEIYRLWLRYSTLNSETRIGKQQLNFGPAQLLRSLRWFDRIDPNDFFARTTGVEAISYRHFIKNKAVWVWIIRSENNTKGLEFYPSVKNKIEPGARMDFPFLSGYWGASAHFRPKVIHPLKSSGNELRTAIDGRWDYFAGFWFESSLAVFREGINEQYSYLTPGVDYTFCGINLTGEHFLLSEVKNKSMKNISNQSALTAKYSINLLDTVSLFFSYNHTEENGAVMLSWQRAYDYIVLNLGVFSFPQTKESIYSRKGAILTLQYNI